MSKFKAFGSVVVAQDPQMREVGDKKVKVVHVSGFTSEAIPGKEERKFHYFDFEAWDSAAEYIATHAKKGDELVVYDATPRQNTWTDQDGNKKSKVVFRINEFRIYKKQQ